MPATESILQAAQAALAAPVLFYLPGAAWAWTLKPADAFERCAASLAIGLPLVLVPAILLAELGAFSIQPMILWAAAAAAYGLRRGGADTARPALPGFLMLTAIAFAILLFPPRGEWILGGWDPGVNINQGLLLARTGAVHQAPDPIWTEAWRAAPQAFARESFGFLEAYPGIPIDPEEGRLRPYFYRATPTFIALLDIVAGRAGALHANVFAALFAAALLTGALRASGLSPHGAALGGILLAGQPIVIAHLGDTASEMLELALVCAAGFLLVRPRDCPNAVALFLALLLAALNRVSFLFMIGLLLPILVAWDSPENERSPVAIRHLAIAAALILGLAWHTWITPESTIKIRHLIPALHALAGAAVAIAFVIDGALLFRKSAAPAYVRVAAVLVPAALLARESIRTDAWREFVRNAPAWWDYAPPLVALMGLAGVALVVMRRAPAAAWLIWLWTCLLTVLLRRHALELYPWATKRWLAVSPPLLAAGIALFCAQTESRFGRPGRAVAAVAITALAIAAFPLSRSAWRASEHVGAHDALAELAARLRPDDLIVADHFRWATPLALAYGFTALNAEPLLAGRGDPEQVAQFLAGTKRRVVLISSTRRGLDAWPEPFRHASPITEPIRIATRERIHHRSHRRFDTRDRAYTLSAAVWEPAP